MTTEDAIYVIGQIGQWMSPKEAFTMAIDALEKQKEQGPIHEDGSKPQTDAEILTHYLSWAESDEENCPYTWKRLAKAIKAGIDALNQMLPEADTKAFNDGVKEGRRLEREDMQEENPKSADSIPSDCVSDAKCEDRWHKVTDSLPDNGRLVLAKDCLGNVLLARYDGENWEVNVYDNEDHYCHNSISKWCEIPSEKQKEQKPDLELIKQSWYTEGYIDGKFKKEPMWNMKTDDGMPRYEKNEKYGQPLEQKPAEWDEEYREEDLRTRFAFYTYKDEDGVLYLSNVFVEETSRNSGFGTKILAAAEKVAETLGAKDIRLKVKQDSPANAWYRKHGYGYMAFEGDYDWLEKTLEYLKPAKSEWSEEDDKIRRNLMSLLVNMRRDRITEETYQKYYPWLKSLPERFNLQPKQEWSEEDEEHLDSIIESYRELLKDYSANHGVDYIPYNTPVVARTVLNDIKFLKSLRPQPQRRDTYYDIIHSILAMLQDKDFMQITPEHRVSLLNDIRVKCKNADECAAILDEPHWKPSEEQMKALKHCVDGWQDCADGVLESLYNELKKL